MIRTVLGPIDDRQFGSVLVHEHVLCDFIGAGAVSRDRYRPADVVAKIEPHLADIKKLGVTGFVDCTPMFIGRDAGVLAELARRTGLHIVTNTGLYAAADEKYMPAYAYERSPEELADGWLAEWHEGIEGTPVRPGFIKIGVNPGMLRPIERKIVTAACRVSRQTGCVIACHTGAADTALETLALFDEQGIAPDRHIFVHAQNEPDPQRRLDYLRRGGWLELDGIGPDSATKHLGMLRDALMAGYEERVLISQDAGWYAVGEPAGGTVRPYDFLPRRFVPLMKESGILEETIHHLLVLNPAKVFRVDGA